MPDQQTIKPTGALLITFLLLIISPRAAELDLKDAVVVTPPNLSDPEKKAVTMLEEEVEKRTHLLWPMATAWPASSAPVIAVGNRTSLERLAKSGTPELPNSTNIHAAEGYQLSVSCALGKPVVYVIGNDARGVLFGVG